MSDFATGFSQILSSAGGVNGIGEGVGDVLCALKGNCQPDSVTVINQQPPQNNNSMLLLVGGGLVLVVVLLVVLKK